MEDIITPLNNIADAIKGGIPTWVTVLGAFTPIILTVITIILSVRMDEQNKKLQQDIHKRDVRNQARQDILGIYDSFCETLVVLKRRGIVASILSDEYATNCWNQELSEVSTKVSKACDRAKLLIDDKELTDYLCLLTQDYHDIYASISRYLYSGVPAQMIQVARNNLQNQYGNAVSNPSFLVSNVAIRNQYIQMCENEITKELQRKIDAYCEMLSDDKFDIKFKKHLVIDELSE